MDYFLTKSKVMKGILTGFLILATVVCSAQQTSFTSEQWQERQEQDELKRLREKESDILCKQAKRNEGKTSVLIQIALDSIALLEKAKNEAIAKIEYEFALKSNPLKLKIELQTRQKPIVPRMVIESTICD
jgi:hypothetical protein